MHRRSFAPLRLRLEARPLRQFVHLRLHTEYSLVDGIVRVPELMAAVSAARMPAVALTDQSNLFAMVKFYKEALSAGVKPFIGVDAWVREAGERAPSRIVFLCQDLVGYRHLTQLVTRSFLEGQQRGAPMLERSWLQSDMLRGLIVLSGGADGDIGQAIARGRDDEALRCLAALAGAVRRPVLSRSAAHRPQRRGSPRQGGGGIGAGAGRRGARDQRRALFDARRIRGARSAGMHS